MRDVGTLIEASGSRLPCSMADAVPREADLIPEVIADLGPPDLVSHCAGPSPWLPRDRLTTSETVASLLVSPFLDRGEHGTAARYHLRWRAAGAASRQEWARM